MRDTNDSVRKESVPDNLGVMRRITPKPKPQVDHSFKNLRVIPDYSLYWQFVLFGRGRLNEREYITPEEDCEIDIRCGSPMVMYLKF